MRWQGWLAGLVSALTLGACTPEMLDETVWVGATVRFAQVGKPADAEQVWIERDGARIEGWFFPATRYRGRAPVVLYFHGNAEWIDNSIYVADTYRARGYAVLLTEYRGYGRSTGRPGAATHAGDAVAFYDWLARRPEIDPRSIVIHGRSLGGSAAGGVLAAGRRPCAVVLESTFTSLGDAVASHGVDRAIAGGHLNTLAAVQRYPGPVLVLHGQTDELIPFNHGQILGTASPTTRLVAFPGGHNPAAPWTDLMGAIDPFLSATPCAPSARPVR